MTSNQELLEMVQAQEERIARLERWKHMTENELEDISATINKINESNFIKADWNELIHRLKRIGALNNVDLRRGQA